MSEHGLILFGHGSRDPRWAEPLHAIAARLRARMPSSAVELAFLEIMAPDLTAAANRLIANGAISLQIIPVFLGQGGHVREDLPRLVRSLRSDHPDVNIRLSVAAGESAAVLDGIAAYCWSELTSLEETPATGSTRSSPLMKAMGKE